MGVPETLSAVFDQQVFGEARSVIRLQTTRFTLSLKLFPLHTIDHFRDCFVVLLCSVYCLYRNPLCFVLLFLYLRCYLFIFF